jgi:hypothetical protein
MMKNGKLFCWKCTLEKSSDFILDCFDSKKLLCDKVSRVEICVSGHNLSTTAKQCLSFNPIEDKAKVIRKKMLRFYFAGEFDVSPFVNMPLSVLHIL